MTESQFFNQPKLCYKFQKESPPEDMEEVPVEDIRVGDEVEWTRAGEWRSAFVTEINDINIMYGTLTVQMIHTDGVPHTGQSIIIVRRSELVLVNGEVIEQ